MWIRNPARKNPSGGVPSDQEGSSNEASRRRKPAVMPEFFQRKSRNPLVEGLLW